MEFNYAVLRSVENDAVDSGYVYVEEEDTMLGQSKNEQDVTADGKFLFGFWIFFYGCVVLTISSYR